MVAPPAGLLGMMLPAGLLGIAARGKKKPAKPFQATNMPGFHPQMNPEMGGSANRMAEQQKVADMPAGGAEAGGGFNIDPSMRAGLMAMAATLLQAKDKGQSLGGALGEGLLNMQQAQAYMGQQEDLARYRKATMESAERNAKNDEAAAAAEAQRQQQLQAEIAKLPPDQQAVAMANPDAFFKARAEQMFAQPKPNQTRNIVQGGMEVTQEFDPATGKWNEIGSGPRWAPQAPGAAAETFAPLSPDEVQALGLPAGTVAQRNSRGKIDILSSPNSGGGRKLVTIADPANPAQSLMVYEDTGEPFMAGGQPARPASARDAGQGFSNAKDLRTAFEKNTNEVRDVATAFRKIEAGFSEKTGAGDLAGIFGYMKMLDPTSVVREGEYATAANSAGVPENIRNMYNKLIDGEKLGENARTQMLSAAASQMGAYRQRYDETSKNYTDLATKLGVDPSLVVLPLEFPEARPSPQQGAPTMSGGAIDPRNMVNRVFGAP